MEVIGKTECGKLVVSGLGKLYFQEGLPLSVMFDSLETKGFRPSWIHLFRELRDNGMTEDRIYHLLNEHVFESYGKEFRDVVVDKLKSIGFLL